MCMTFRFYQHIQVAWGCHKTKFMTGPLLLVQTKHIQIKIKSEVRRVAGVIHTTHVSAYEAKIPLQTLFPLEYTVTETKKHEFNDIKSYEFGSD